MSASDPESPPSAPRPRHALFEPAALLLLSLATVGTAWCSYQAAAWGGIAQRQMNLSAAASRRAVTAQLQSSQLALMDVMLFSSYVDARAGGREELAHFYSDRFRPEAKAAFEAWLATRPFENPAAPPHPFVPEFYRPRLLAEAEKAEAESHDLWRQGGESASVGRNYVLVTVLLASALFCGGTASRFSATLVRKGVLAFGLAAFLFALGRLLFLPAG